MASDILEQLERSLPNGFHDAQIKGINLNYVERTIVFEMRLWVGDLESADKAEREAYRLGVLIISEFDFCVIEPPDLRYPYHPVKAVRVDSGAGNPQSIPLLENIPEDTFAHWFFVNEWNSFIYFIARAARLEMSQAEA